METKQHKQWVKEIKREIRKHLEIQKYIPKLMGYGKSNTKSKVYSSKCLYLKRRKSSNKQLNIIPQGTRKKTKLKVSGRKEISIRAEINKTEKRKTIEKKSMKLRVGFLKRYTTLTSLQLDLKNSVTKIRNKNGGTLPLIL